MPALEGFTRETFTHERRTHGVYRGGSGPAVIVLAEMPGITPLVVDFARRVVSIGCTAVLPHLFGTPGKPEARTYLYSSLLTSCMAREFAALATKTTPPAALWLRALARSEHERCGGPGVGAVGMCFTGGFALAMTVDAPVLAPVVAQPALPMPLSPWHHRSIGLSDGDLERVKERVRDGMCVLGLRFSEDRLVPEERFARLREELGSGFIAVEIDSSPGNPWGHRKDAHSVLTRELRDELGQPTRDALCRVLDLFRAQLLPAT